MSNAEDIARKWIALYNDGSPDFYGSDRFLDLYAADVNWQEMPTSWFPSGRCGNREKLRGAVKYGQSILRDRKVTLEDVIRDPAGRKAAFRYTWTAVLAADIAHRSAGSRVSASVGQFIEVQDGLIVRSLEYIGFGG